MAMSRLDKKLEARGNGVIVSYFDYTHLVEHEDIRICLDYENE